MADTQEYVVGFLFTEDYGQVLLIKKNRPEWQKGRLNGVGGKIEKNESPEEAMRREFLEEAGVDVRTWQEVLILGGIGWRVHFFRAFDTYAFNHTESKTDEAIFKAMTSGLPTYVIPNLHWIIPFCMFDYEFPLEVREEI